MANRLITSGLGSNKAKMGELVNRRWVQNAAGRRGR